jgi:hypothetical protein
MRNVALRKANSRFAAQNMRLNLIEVWWRLFRRQALAGVDFADGHEIDKATRVAIRQLNRKASPWVWDRKSKPLRHRRHTLVYRI